MPATGASKPCSEAVPNSPTEGRTSGSARTGTPSSSHSSSSHAPRRMSYSSVREALDGSVANSPVSLNVSQASIVPKTARPSRARCSSPSTLRSSHSIFVPLKYGSSTRPVRSRMRGSWPAARSSSQRSAVRRARPTRGRGRGAVRPDGGGGRGVARRRVPDAARLALVGDPDRVQLASAGVVERLARNRPRDLPDLGDVVLDPAGPWEVLLELAVGPPRQL